MYPPPIWIFNQTMIDSSNSSSIIVPLLTGMTLSSIAFLTAFGNLIVLAAFYYDRKLRTINDYFILNMAIADFLVGFICIPFYIPFSLTQSWPFGRLFCKIWVTIDDVATMASVINIVAITINRYWSIAYPLTYRKYVTQHLVYSVMAGVWCLSFINFAPGIWLLSLFNKEENVTPSDCSGDYNKSFVYMLIAQFNYFIWPFILLCVLNMLIMLNIWKRTRKMSRLMSTKKYFKEKESSLRTNEEREEEEEEEEDDQHLSILSKHRKNSLEYCPSTIVEMNENIGQTTSSNKTHSRSFPYYDKNKLSKTSEHRMTIISNKSSQIISSSKSRSLIKSEFEESHLSSPRKVSSQKSMNVHYCSSVHSMIEYRIESEYNISTMNLNERNRSKHQCREYRQKRSRIARDRKAARSLFILVLVFLLFLFPYVICATMTTAGLHIPSILYEISFWLLWINSTCNPFIYPFIQIKYRRAYLKLFQSWNKHLSFSRSSVHSF